MGSGGQQRLGDAVQRRADAIQLGEMEDELERREAKCRRYGH